MLKDVLIDQFNKCYDKNGWFVAIRNAVDGITAAEAAWKPNGADNSVWHTMSHLTFYNYAYVERFKGVDFRYETDDNDETFKSGLTDEEWMAEIERFDSVMMEFRLLIESADDEKFHQMVSAEKQTTWAILIGEINAHNAYHAGQILMLRKLQGSWDRAKGVS